MPTPNHPYLTTSVVIGGKDVFARIDPSIYFTIGDKLEEFKSAIKNSRRILDSSSQGHSGIKHRTDGKFEVKINSGERLLSSSGDYAKENECLLLVFDTYERKHK